MYTDKSFLQIHLYTVLAAVFHLLSNLDFVSSSYKCAQSLPSFHFLFNLATVSKITRVLGLSSYFFMRKSLYYHVDSQELWGQYVCKPWGGLQGFFLNCAFLKFILKV